MYDAVICPKAFPGTDEDRHYAQKRVFGPILGSARVKSRELTGFSGELSLITRFDDDTAILYPKGHPRNPEYRHLWYESKRSGDSYAAGDEVPPERISDGGIYIGVMKD